MEITLKSGTKIPRIGLGTYPMNDAEAAENVEHAIEVGYRHFDTAENYGNEEGVGNGIRSSGIDRAEVFITTKFNAKWHGESEVAEAFRGSADRLGVDHIDLLLIHWPNPGQDRFVAAWRGMIGLKEQGLVRSIGVSNFKPVHLQRLIDETGVVPDVNQIQYNPYLQRHASAEFHARHGIVTVAWSPIGKNSELLSEQAVLGVAAETQRTPAQVVLRWHLQLGNIAIPKSSNPERIRANIQVFDFELTDAQMNRIGSLDRGEGEAADSDVFGH